MKHVGPYRIDGELGSGGIGTVYKAEAPDGATVALKLLHGEGDEESRSRFAREATIRIEHPNVIRVIDSGQTPGGEPYLVMELLEGEPLAARIKRGPISPSDAVKMALQVCRGLEAAHARGVVHRDLKPDNIFCCKDGSFKLLDFGIAHLTSRETRVTETGIIVGTPWYLAPEQAQGDRDLDERVDVWALGAVLYEALTGKTPFEREGTLAVVVAIVRDEFEAIEDLAPSTPPALVAIVERCLKKERDSRWPSATVLRRALEGLDMMDDTPSQQRFLEAQPALAADEQRLVAVLLAEGVRDVKLARSAIEKRGGSYMPLIGGRALGVFGGASWEGDELERVTEAARAVSQCAARVSAAAGRAESSKGRISGAVLQAAEHGCRAQVEGVTVNRAIAKALTMRYRFELEADGIYRIAADRDDEDRPTRRRPFRAKPQRARAVREAWAIRSCRSPPSARSSDARPSSRRSRAAFDACSTAALRSRSS